MKDTTSEFYSTTSDYSGHNGGVHNMLLNDMIVIQANGLYYIYSQQQELKAMIYFPPDNQQLYDFKCLDIITKAIAIRWGIIPPPRKRK